MNQDHTHPLIRERRIMVVPGVYDVLSAKIAERAGFSSVALTGYGVAATSIHRPAHSQPNCATASLPGRRPCLRTDQRSCPWGQE